MCTPTLVVVATLVATAASTGVSIAQAQAQGKAAEDAAEFEADKARYDAIILKRSADVALVKNGISARREYGRIKTQLAATGSALDFGSTAKVTQEVVRFQAIDQALISQNAQNAAIGLDLKSQSLLFNGRSARRGANIASVGLALSGAAAAGNVFTSQVRAQQRLDALTDSPSDRRIDAFG